MSQFFCLSVTQNVERQSGIVASHVTDNCPLAVFGAGGAGNLQHNGLISHLTPRSHVLLTEWLSDYATWYFASLAVSTALWPLSMCAFHIPLYFLSVVACWFHCEVTWVCLDYQLQLWPAQVLNVLLGSLYKFHWHVLTYFVCSQLLYNKDLYLKSTSSLTSEKWNREREWLCGRCIVKLNTDQFGL